MKWKMTCMVMNCAVLPELQGKKKIKLANGECHFTSFSLEISINQGFFFSKDSYNQVFIPKAKTILD